MLQKEYLCTSASAI